MKMIKYQHKLRDKAGGKHAGVHITSHSHCFSDILQRRFIEMNQFRRLSCSRGANSFSSPSLEYCSAAGGGVRLKSNPGFTTLRNTSQFKHSPDKSSTSVCNKTEANSNSVISSERSGTSTRETKLRVEREIHSDRGKTVYGKLY